MTTPHHLRVIVELHGSVVEDRLLAVRDGVRLGDSRWADVSFPGADIPVIATPDGLEVRGRLLQEGVPLSLSLGPVSVTMEAGDPGLPRRWGWETPSMDLRVLVATAAVALTGTFVESVDRFVQNDPIASEQIAELLQPGWADDASHTARAHLQAPDELPEGVEPELAFEVPTSEPLVVRYIDRIDETEPEAR